MSMLAKILEQKRREIEALDVRSLRRAADESPAPRDFRSALTPGPSPSRERGVRLIAELKRASPSRGLLAPHLDLFQVADTYAENGASAISVLTDEKFFLGKLETLRELRYTRSMQLPLLRKDFIIAEVQMYESRASGADAVLLIAAALTNDNHLAALHALALDLGLTPLVEVHDEKETERALHLDGVRLIGINNRDLATFDVSLETTERIRPLIPEAITVVAESGVLSAEDVERLAKANVDAILVGEALITSANIGEKVKELCGMESHKSKV